MMSLPGTKFVPGNLLHIKDADSYYILPILSSRQDGTKVLLSGKLYFQSNTDLNACQSSHEIFSSLWMRFYLRGCRRRGGFSLVSLVMNVVYNNLTLPKKSGSY